MLGVDRDADAAVETRIRIGWNKFRQLVPGFRKTRVFLKKPNPVGFFGVLSGFIGFLVLLGFFGQAGKNR